MFWQNVHNQLAAEKGVYESVEQTILNAARWLELGIELVGAIIIGIGVILAIYRLFRHFKEEQSKDFNHIRLTLGKFLVLALEFQVAADIISTAIAPSWEQIGKLAAVAAIRTALNYFLIKELEHERRREEDSKAEI